MYMYIYIYIYMYTCVYIYIFICTCAACFADAAGLAGPVLSCFVHKINGPLNGPCMDPLTKFVVYLMVR